MKRAFSLFVIILFVFACEKKEDKFDTLKTEVFAIHDEVMPKMGELMSLKKKILDKVEGSANPDELRGIALSLEKAQEGMMSWMNDWSKNSTPHVNNESTEEEKMTFINAEIVRVKKVKEDINSSIAAAKKALENN
ncbi:hypothetical protein AWW67_15465 [Roseivirga seohaensis]|uniref:Viral A-type inclusion protein n=2 Tax=Roseivirga seohaensis TaxID=1914963 RepID=A0A0L8ANV0_9BACT|nr:hypothetical protein [Roseivirga seohaensis]KOF03905.1 hypothetical protein OB69_02515 [Roseivirga seohaensis subsp. aquiponti]KYG85387.1 hypothetical protein AWW67_15465 [Roseivirga seohaensis]